MHSLAETKGDLEAPLEVDGAVEGLQGGHAGFARAPARVAELQHRQQRRPAVVVVVAHVQRQVARALEAEAAHRALGACNDTRQSIRNVFLFRNDAYRTCTGRSM